MQRKSLNNECIWGVGKKFFFSAAVLLFIKIQLCASDIAVVTLIVGKEYKNAVKTGIKNKDYYCKKHGYDFYCCEEHLDLTRPIPWSKIPLIQKIMEEHSYEWIFWTDADSLIMNTNITLENFIDEDFNFIISKERDRVNSGEFLIKNCQWSKNFLDTVYRHTECINHEWWEQMAIIKELDNEKFKPQIKILPQRALNARAKDGTHCEYKPGDFIIHFAGKKNKKNLKKYMENYAKEVIK